MLLHNQCIRHGDDLDDFIEEIDVENIKNIENNFEEVGRNDRIESEEKRNMLCQLLQ